MADRRFPVRLLLLEGRASDAELIVAQLTAGGFICTWIRVQTEEAFRAALDDSIDAVLADLMLPGFSGIDALRIVRERHPDLPFIVVSAAVGEDQAVAAIKAGADDYLFKDQLARIGPALERALAYRRLRIDAARATSEAAAQRRMLQSVLDTMADGVLVADERGELTFVNPAARQMIGDVILGQRPEEWTADHGLVDPVTGRPVEADELPLRRASRGEPTDAFEMIVARPGVSSRIVSASGRPLVGASGATTGGVSTWRDITYQRLAQEALRKSEERYRDLFWNDLVGHFVSTPEGKITACNPAFASMFGFASVEQALETAATSVYADPAERLLYVDRVRREKSLSHIESALRTLDGRAITAIENVRGSFDDQGRLVEIRGSIVDTTEQRAIELQLRHSQKMDAIGQLASGIAHDFNDLLTVILGYAEELRAEASANEQTRHHLDQVIGAARQAANLTRQLAAFGRRHVMAPAMVDLNEVVRDAEPMLGHVVGDRVTLELSLAQGVGLVAADRGGIEQVLTNLVLNARDAMPGGGVIRVTTDLDPPCAVLAVSDSGVGMDAATRSRIFEPFFTIRPGGESSGLGLSVVYGIVTRHGGTVTVASDLGEGSTFRVCLPLASAGAHPAVDLPLPPPPDLLDGSESVLVVDDDLRTRALVRKLLVRHGYRVAEAADGIEAIEALSANPMDLVITDVVMPRLGGVELAQLAAVHQPRTRVIYMSGCAPELGALAIDEAQYLAKPFTAAELLRRVRVILDAPQR